MSANKITTRASSRDAGYLFSPQVLGEKPFSPAMVQGANLIVQKDGYFAKVPLTSVGTRSSYKFWRSTSGTWEKDPTLGTKDPQFISSETISYNDYLRKFVTFDFIKAFGVATPEMYVQSAPHPWGPWSLPKIAFKSELTPSAVKAYNYFGEQHPELSTLNGREMRVSYTHNTFQSTQDISVYKVTLLSVEDDAICSDVAYPTQVSKGQVFYVGVNMKNSGTRSWLSPNYQIVEGDYNGAFQQWQIAPTSVPAAGVAAGATGNFIFTAKAPSTYPSGYNFVMRLRMRDVYSGMYFGATCIRTIKVV